ncbi:hypothetical protein A2Z33_01455 [Candidatus Gottesmanbacteria bacterium RBG_16_52_11]|uniref:Uncharacterized protein n=1 Tax=Candidatus Gottesmanbacteria bacterium RBG_16_52_11 TaxID=1798374 RepID=A0A1F5YNV9_9BACT|nr:MAG: hypothetical protein A2Z33_01455 [Candidatus Gottesmanbacteria bacterium RBG_16_52_11]
MRPQFIQLIADYQTGDPAFSEVIQKLTLLIPGVTVIPTSVPRFSTLATGFWTGQLASVNPVPDMVIYTNTAPRRDQTGSRTRNEGERLVYAELDNGVRIIGVNAGYCFSFVKTMISKFVWVNVANRGSQFRSRDFYPEAVAGIIRNEPKWIGSRIGPDTLPEVPPGKLAWIDGYGNLKTTTPKSAVSFKLGQPVLIELNGMGRTAYYSDGTFAVREGEMAFAPGSSGGDDPFMEIFLRGLSAHDEFGNPDTETQFRVKAQR